MAASRSSESTSNVTRPSRNSGLCTPGSADSSCARRAVSATTVVRVRCRSWASVPLCTVRPDRMMLTRSHRASTSARMWLESSTVAPRPLASSTHPRNADSMIGSSPEVGSSSSNSSAPVDRAATSATFCRFPLE